MRRFVLRVERGFGLLYDPRDQEYYRLSEQQVLLLRQSREVGLTEATERLAESVGRYEALCAGEALKERGFLEDAYAGQVVELELPATGYSAPLAAHLGMTTACNFACNHCYSSSGRRSPDELSFEECRKIVDELGEIGCCKLILGGGEPFLRRELPELIRHATERGVDTFIHTNGTLLDGPALEKLAQSPPTGLTISLDGATAESNDRVRGAGTFQAILASLERIRRHYPPGFALAMTITSVNLDEAALAVELAHDQGASMLLLRPPFPAGNLLQNDDLMIDLSAFWRALELAHEKAEALGQCIHAPRPGGPVLPTDFEGFGCIAAHLVLGITPTGDVTPCLNLPARFVGGNVRTSSVLEVWRRGRTFEMLRNLSPNTECERCAHYSICRGGCRIRALHHSGRIDGPDSWCYLFAELGGS